MNDATKPVFLGGTVAEHLLFVVSLCRFQHHELPLAWVHYLTWSVVGIALHTIAFTIAGPHGPVVLGLALSAWAIRLDVAVGLLFSVLQATYAWTTLHFVRVLPSSSVLVVLLALVASVLAIATEVVSHLFRACFRMKTRRPRLAMRAALCLRDR